MLAKKVAIPYVSVEERTKKIKKQLFMPFLHEFSIGSGCMCHPVTMVVRGQLVGVGSLLPPHGPQELNSGFQVW